jgi:hypothetical protein
MHAVSLVLRLSNEEEAVQSLHRDVIPQVQKAAGFRTGTWFGDSKTGHAVLVFDTAEQAEQAAPPVNTTMPGCIVERSDIYPVTGQV